MRKIMIIWMIILLSSISFASKLDEEIESNGAASVIVILKDSQRGAMTQKSMRSMSALEDDIQVKHKYSSIKGYSANITEDGLAQLRDDPNVAAIYLDEVRHLGLSTSASQINATRVWGLDPFGWNITGRNQTICVIDSGVDYRHPNLGNCTTEQFLDGNCTRVVSGWDFVHDDNDPRDDQGHGTHVAGILISNHSSNRGIAPEAKIVAIKVCDNSTAGSCSVSDIISGIDWCISNKTKFNISVLTMSIGGGSYSNACDSEPDANASNAAVSSGIFVSIAAGNDGSSTSISAPACASNVSSVGSVDSGDSISGSSNRDTFNTIFAPGASITSTVPIDSATTYTDGSGFMTLGGTSMATPHVAAAAALLLSYNSSLRPSDIKRILSDTGKPISDSGTIYRRIDALNAARKLDKVYPLWKQNASNNTGPYRNGVIQFNISINDTIGLSSYKFCWNDTGAWANVTNASISSKAFNISLNKTVTASAAKEVFWKIYFNDTGGNWNFTDEWRFTVANTLPETKNVTINSTDSLNLTNGSLVGSFAFSDVDEGNLVLNETRWYNNSRCVDALDNISVVGSGNLSRNSKWIYSARVFDGIDWSAWANSSNITVAGSPTTHATLFSVADYDSDGNIELNWSDDGNESAESYRVYRSSANISAINDSVELIASGILEGVRFYEDNRSLNGSTYWYTLVTVDSAGIYSNSYFSPSSNATANDTVIPKIPRMMNVTSASGLTTINWSFVSHDILGNIDNFSLSYKIWYKIGIDSNLSKGLVNETADYLKTVDSSACASGYCTTTHSLSATAVYHYFVTTVDDALNENLTLDNSTTGNWLNLTATAAPVVSASTGGGGGGGSPKKTNLDLKQEFLSSGYAAKQTQGDEAVFTLEGKNHSVKVEKLRNTSVAFGIDSTVSVFYEGNSRQFDVNSDGIDDIEITLSKIDGGRAQVLYKLLARPLPQTKIENNTAEPVEIPSTPAVVVHEELAKDKMDINSLLRFAAISGCVFFFAAFLVFRKSLKKI